MILINMMENRKDGWKKSKEDNNKGPKKVAELWEDQMRKDAQVNSYH